MADLLTRFRHLMRPIVRFSYRSGWIVGIQSRNELPFLLNALGLTGEGAEIGVRAGLFSRYLLQHWQGSVLHSVDPWRYSPEEVGGAGHAVSQAEHDAIYAEATAALRPFGRRSNIVRAASVDAARQFADGALDFCYIDALHFEAAIRADIEAWAPKVRCGGLLAGHDYDDDRVDSAGVPYAVKTVVDAFARRRGLPLKVSREARAPSWFLFLP